MASISSDVEHLRQQYHHGKKQHDRLVVQYDSKSFQDGDELKKSGTQTEPNVQINVDNDTNKPHFTLVNFYINLFFLTNLFFPYSIDLSRP